LINHPDEEKKMNKAMVKIIVCAATTLAFSSANAEMLINPVGKAKSGAMEGGAYFGTSSVEYEFNGNSYDIDRTFLGVSLAYGMTSALDLYGTFAYTLEAELEPVPGDDSGFMFGVGARGVIPSNLGVKLHGYGQLLFIDEEYGRSVEGEETYIMGGIVASKALDTNIKVYGGLELNLMSDMEVETTDADRDDFLGFRLGANFNTGKFIIDVNAALVHESGLNLSISTPL
jgi:hypothetical protein